MKKLIFIILITIFFNSYIWAEEGDLISKIITSNAEGFCPKTYMFRECMKCHTAPNFKLKEGTPDETLVYPVLNMKIVNGKGYFFIREIDDYLVKKFLDYLDDKNIKHAIFEIHNPGGGLFAASRIVNLMDNWAKNGKIIETRLYGFALSGGFMVFIAGSKGYRFVSPYADLMWHEIQSIEMFAFKISTPSDKEEEARILRHLQDVRNSWIATRGKLTKEQLDEKIRKKEWWFTGIEAVQYGFADGFTK